MTIEQKKVLQALQFAIQMEVDGKKFYQEASRSSDNHIGTDLFQALAMEEDKHCQTFKKIYQTINNREAWPKIDSQAYRGKRLQNIFAEVVKNVGSHIKVLKSEVDAIQTAMNMEDKAYDYQIDQSKGAVNNIQKEFYKLLAAEERGHYLILLDYYEYLMDPGAWFVKQEHPSLDGVQADGKAWSKKIT